MIDSAEGDVDPGIGAQEKEIAGLRAELTRVAATLEGLEQQGHEPTRDLRRLLARQIDLLRDTIEARVALLRVRSGRSWQLLEAARRQRLRLRRGSMVVKGLRRPWRRLATVPGFVRRAPLGVNVAGYLDTESGMGEAARLSIRSLESAGVPMVLNNVTSRLRMLDPTYKDFTESNPHPFNLVHLNADNMESFARARGRRYFRDRYTIGFWFWELTEFRRDWMPAFAFVDEVWTASESGRVTLAGCAPLPVVYMPLPIVVPTSSVHGRSHFGLSGDAFVFLFTFDVSSQMERKNPFGLLSAFRRAFGDRRDVVLVLKFTNAEYDPREVRRLYEVASGLNTLLLDGYVTRGEMAGLLACADCYVSLHRSEGLGLGIGEAMALGKPVIATGYSGIAEFMTPANSYPVRYRVVPIPRDHGPYLEGFSWAEPDLDQASTLMREVVADRAGRIARGRQAATDTRAFRTPAQTGARVRRRLEEIQFGRRFQPDLGKWPGPGSS